MAGFWQRFNIVSECRNLHLSLWSCPPFLFVIMGVINISAIIISYLLATSLVEDPALVVIIVSLVTVIIFTIGHSIVHGFSKVAEANRFKTEFIAIVSHQLRSPLSIFKWSLNAITQQRSGGTPPASDASYFDILTENTEKMIQLVNMLLEVSRIEAGSLILRRDAVRLDVLTEAAVHSFSAYARASNINLDYASPVKMAAVRGDQEKLKMVVQNLIDNAVRYTLGGGRVAITVTPFGSDEVEWRIRDSGVGIPKEQQRYIFHKFFRSDGAATREVRGWGLGLYVAHSIVTALGGEIGFESEEGRGSSFWFRLPAFQL